MGDQQPDRGADLAEAYRHGYNAGRNAPRQPVPRAVYISGAYDTVINDLDQRIQTNPPEQETLQHALEALQDIHPHRGNLYHPHQALTDPTPQPATNTITRDNVIAYLNKRALGAPGDRYTLTCYATLQEAATVLTTLPQWDMPTNHSHPT